VVNSTPGRSKAFSSLGARVVTGALYGLVLLGTIALGGSLGLASLLALLGGLALSELYRITRRERRTLAEFCGIAAVVAMPLAVVALGLPGLLAVVTVLVVASLIWHVALTNLRISDTAVVVFGALYIGFTLSHLVLIRSLEDGVMLVLVLLVSVWASDVLAYFVGSLIGSHKLAPRISPNKSWEGFIAGLMGTVAVWLALPLLIDGAPRTEFLLVIGVAVAVAAVSGDLFESRIKREVGVKDSGQLLPGHGGVLDRIDSLLLVSLVAYYALLAGGIR
jgi:phosphatidate cytidylyltransferase